jgi:uncharacterized protein (UPF0210 family)
MPMTHHDAALMQDATEALQTASRIIQQLNKENTRWQQNFNQAMAYAEALLEHCQKLSKGRKR